jgi:hypothetical protein
VTFILIISVASNAFAGGNLSLFNQTKKAIEQPVQSEKGAQPPKIKNHRRLKVDDLKSNPTQSNDDPEEEDPWDDGVDMGC